MFVLALLSLKPQATLAAYTDAAPADPTKAAPAPPANTQATNVMSIQAVPPAEAAPNVGAAVLTPVGVLPSKAAADANAAHVLETTGSKQ